MKSSENFYREGNIKFVSGDYQGSIADFTNAIESDPRHTAAFNNRGVARNKLNDTHGELRDYNSALLTNPEDLCALYNRCVARIKQKEYLKAINDLTKYLCLRSSFSIAYFYTVDQNVNPEQYSESIAERLKALKIEPIMVTENKDVEPKDLEVFNNIVAIAEITKYIADGTPLFAESYCQRAELRAKFKDFHGALADFNKIISYAKPEYNLYAKIAYIKDAELKDYAGALIDYNEALLLEPEDEELLLRRSSVKHSLNDIEGSISDLTEIIRLYNDLDPEEKDDIGFYCTMAYSNRAYIKSKMNNPIGAIDDYTKAIKVDPSFFLALTDRASVKLKLKDYTGAIKDCSKSLRISKQFGDAYYIRGKAKFELQDYVGAIKDYKNALKINPNLADAKFELDRADAILSN